MEYICGTTPMNAAEKMREKARGAEAYLVITEIQHAAELGQTNLFWNLRFESNVKALQEDGFDVQKDAQDPTHYKISW